MEEVRFSRRVEVLWGPQRETDWARQIDGDWERRAKGAVSELGREKGLDELGEGGPSCESATREHARSDRSPA